MMAAVVASTALVAGCLNQIIPEHQPRGDQRLGRRHADLRHGPPLGAPIRSATAACRSSTATSRRSSTPRLHHDDVPRRQHAARARGHADRQLGGAEQLLRSVERLRRRRARSVRLHRSAWASTTRSCSPRPAWPAASRTWAATRSRTTPIRPTSSGAAWIAAGRPLLSDDRPPQSRRATRRWKGHALHRADLRRPRCSTAEHRRGQPPLRDRRIEVSAITRARTPTASAPSASSACRRARRCSTRPSRSAWPGSASTSTCPSSAGST